METTKPLIKCKVCSKEYKKLGVHMVKAHCYARCNTCLEYFHKTTLQGGVKCSKCLSRGIQEVDIYALG